MPPYSQIHWEYLVYIVLGGILLVALTWLAVRSAELTVGKKRPEEPEEDDKLLHRWDGVSEQKFPIPLFIVVVFVLWLAWALAYTWWSADNFLH